MEAMNLIQMIITVGFGLLILWQSKMNGKLTNRDCIVLLLNFVTTGLSCTPFPQGIVSLAMSGLMFIGNVIMILLLFKTINFNFLEEAVIEYKE